MKNINKIEFKYLSRHWNKPLSELVGYKMVEDIMSVFGYNEQLSKYVIRQWFSKCYKLEDDWFEKPKNIASKIIDECGNDYGLGYNDDVLYDDVLYGDDAEGEDEEDDEDDISGDWGAIPNDNTIRINNTETALNSLLNRINRMSIK